MAHAMATAAMRARMWYLIVIVQMIVSRKHLPATQNRAQQTLRTKPLPKASDPSYCAFKPACRATACPPQPLPPSPPSSHCTAKPTRGSGSLLCAWCGQWQKALMALRECAVKDTRVALSSSRSKEIKRQIWLVKFFDMCGRSQQALKRRGCACAAPWC